MAIKIKTQEEINHLKEVGLKLGRVFDKIKEQIKPGVSTKYLDDLIGKYIKDEGCIPTFKGYGGFPNNACISVNDVLIHGIGSNTEILKEGDIVSLDIGATDKKTGFIGDCARTYGVGKISMEAENLIKTVEVCFYEAIKVIKPGAKITDISNTFEQVAYKEGYSLTDEYCGHGVGKNLHEDPQIPNCGPAHRGATIVKNMCLAVEPMILAGKKDVVVDPHDGWTVRSKDHKLTAHYENTLVVTENGCEITTVDSSVISYLGGNGNV